MHIGEGLCNRPGRVPWRHSSSPAQAGAALRSWGVCVQDVTFHAHFRCAVPFLRGIDVAADVLGVPRRDVRAVIGGHSKRATGAYTTAGIDGEGVAGVVYMGTAALRTHDSQVPTARPSVARKNGLAKAPGADTRVGGRRHGM